MGRTLKRVPLDFDWPIDTIWPGYMTSMCNVMEKYYNKRSEMCEVCKHYAQLMKLPTKEITSKDCPHFTFFDPPIGEGYQMWETTSEGSPQSPVFKTLEELAGWCAKNVTTFGDFKANKEEWIAMLDDGFVFHKQGNAIFM